jgi:hypothetical protein
MEGFGGESHAWSFSRDWFPVMRFRFSTQRLQGHGVTHGLACPRLFCYMRREGISTVIGDSGIDGVHPLSHSGPAQSSLLLQAESLPL